VCVCVCVLKRGVAVEQSGQERQKLVSGPGSVAGAEYDSGKLDD